MKARKRGRTLSQQWRYESDSMGKVRVPATARYGPQTARAVENFPISSLRFPRSFLRALGLVKKHAAITNAELGLLPRPLAALIARAAQEVAAGELDHEFVVDIFQTGSGTSTNMNANEVIAHRAGELSKRGQTIHPNDHVNLGQSSNDVIPTAIHLAALEQINNHLLPSFTRLQRSLQGRGKAFHDVLKMGRTHLQDATPVRLGQEFRGYAAQVDAMRRNLATAARALEAVALGGTAVGTGLNTHPQFARKVLKGIARETKLTLFEAADHFAAQSSIDDCVLVSGALKSAAVGLIKIANDIRWLGSGPRCGLGEIHLPATQPGSSIMPGKVNPVMCEMLIQVCAQVFGNDLVTAFSATAGAFELNTMLPVTAFNLLQSIELLGNGVGIFAKRCIDGLEAEMERCEANIEQSLSMCTALAPELGYDRAAEIAKIAYKSGRTVRDVAAELSGLPAKKLARLLDPARQAGR
jgi:fumarate hydratase class II